MLIIALPSSVIRGSSIFFIAVLVLLCSFSTIILYFEVLDFVWYSCNVIGNYVSVFSVSF